MDKEDQLKETTFFESNWKEMLDNASLTKAEFCRRMGVEPSNITKLFKTKNAITLNKVSKILGVPVDVLIDGDRYHVYENLTIVGCVRVNGKAFILNNETDIDNLYYQIHHYQIKKTK